MKRSSFTLGSSGIRGALGFSLAVSALACSAGGGASAGAGEGLGDKEHANGGASSAPSPSGTGDGTGGGTFSTNVGSPRSRGGEADGGCFSQASAAEQVIEEITEVTHTPVDMLIMYDQSGSMSDDTPVGAKWDAIAAALTGFVNSPESADIGIGIAYFPLEPPPCTAPSDTCACIPFTAICFSLGGGSCDPADYAVPDVPIQLLPGVAQAIIGSVNSHSPAGGTPTRPALEGAHQYAAQWAAANPDRKTIVVLATDGDPTGCPANSVQDVANVAAAALAATPSVQTFVIGVGSSLTSLNAIAAAGGSGQALIVDAASGDPTQQFLDAMNQIRTQVTTTTQVVDTVPVPCQWTIPEAPDGQTFDRNKVNVDFAQGDGASQRIGAVGSEAECAGVSGGWYYDNPDLPTQVHVCPQTCSTIQSIEDARVDIVFGCETEQIVR